MTKEKKIKLKAFDVQHALAKKFSGDEVAYFEEVRNGTGFSRQARTADGLSMDLWPSRGLEVSGYEIKVARSDWLHELKDPAKAGVIQKYCNRWWLVTANQVATIEEIPVNWGWMHWTGEKFMVKKKAPLLEPVNLDRLFVASLLRSANRASDADRLKLMQDENLKDKLEKARAEGHRQGSYEVRKDNTEALRYMAILEECEKQGFKLDRYNEANDVELFVAACKLLDDIGKGPDHRQRIYKEFTERRDHVQRLATSANLNAERTNKELESLKILMTRHGKQA